MEVLDWSGCALVSSDPQVVHGEPVFRGTRLPAATVLDNVDAYLDSGCSLENAVQETLRNFPTIPNGELGIHIVLDYRELQHRQLSA